MAILIAYMILAAPVPCDDARKARISAERAAAECKARYCGEGSAIWCKEPNDRLRETKANEREACSENNR